MIRMFSGLVAPVIGGLAGLFKKDGVVSVYRIVLAVTVAVVGWGFWAGWVQWVILGQGIAAGGLGTAVCTFLARWVLFSWVGGVLLASFCDDEDEFLPIIPVLLVLCAFGTVGNVVYTHDFFTVAERTHYRATVSCEHCGASCYANVRLGESWTDWESVECCRCGIAALPENVPEYADSREAWDARVLGGGADGTED